MCLVRGAGKEQARHFKHKTVNTDPHPLRSTQVSRHSLSEHRRKPARATRARLQQEAAGALMANKSAQPEESVSDEWRAGPFSQLTFSWIFPLIRLGAKRPLMRDDCGHAPRTDHSSLHASRFETAFRARRSTKAALIATFWSRMTKGALCKGMGDAAAYAQIWAVRAVISHAEAREGGVANAWPSRALAGGGHTFPRAVDLAVLVLTLAPMLSGLCLHWFYHHVMIDGLHARSALKSVLFRKLLRVHAVGGGHADSSITASVDGHVTGGIGGGAVAATDKKAGKGKADKKGGTAKAAQGGGGGGGGGGSGKLLNLQNGDARAIENVYHMCVYWIFVPIMIGIYLFVLASEIGLAALVGLCVMALAVPAQIVLSGRIKKAQAQLLAASDRRMRGVKESIQGILVVKTFGWERFFAHRVSSARGDELRHNAAKLTLTAVSSAVMEAVPIICALASLASYGFIYPDQRLTASRAFVSLLVFNQLRLPLIIVPFTIVVTISGLAAVKRIDEFLGSAEVEPSSVRTQLPQTDGLPVDAAHSDATICIRAGRFRWPDSLLTPAAVGDAGGGGGGAGGGAGGGDGGGDGGGGGGAFELGAAAAPIDLRFWPGLTVVVGAVASGKSTLLAALLGELQTLGGDVSVLGRVALCPQLPWIFNATLRENVLFGAPLDEARYRAVLSACALEPDLSVLPSGDQTEIGERGVRGGLSLAPLCPLMPPHAPHAPHASHAPSCPSCPSCPSFRS